MAQLVVLNGACAGTVFVLPDVPTVVGRSPESHLQISDPWISGMHAMFDRRADGVWVVDLDSRNGTFLGEERVTESPVTDGAVVRFGRTDVRVELRAATADASRGATPRAGGEKKRETIRAENTLSTRNPLLAREPRDEPRSLSDRPAAVLRMALDAAGFEALPGAPERLRVALDAAARAALDAGAAVTRLGASGVLALFGVAASAPDASGSALEAARAARRAVRAVGGIELRAAVEWGLVLSGQGAGAAGFDLVALGPAAERAERLLAVARRGEILAGPGASAAGGLASVGVRDLGAEQVEVFQDDAA